MAHAAAPKRAAWPRLPPRAVRAPAAFVRTGLSALASSVAVYDLARPCRRVRRPRARSASLAWGRRPRKPQRAPASSRLLPFAFRGARKLASMAHDNRLARSDIFLKFGQVVWRHNRTQYKD